MALLSFPDGYVAGARRVLAVLDEWRQVEGLAEPRPEAEVTNNPPDLFELLQALPPLDESGETADGNDPEEGRGSPSEGAEQP